MTKSMLHKIGVQLLHDSRAELLYQKFVLFLLLRELQLVLLSISDDIFADQVFEFVSILEIRILADNAINSVVVEILQQFFKIGSNLGINCLLFLFFLWFFRWLSCFLQKLTIFLFDNNSCLGF